MAADLEQSKSSITRVMTKQQAPSGRLIENLAKNRAVNLEWLFRGEGDPWDRPEPIAIPVFTKLLPADPREADASSIDWLALSARQFQPTRYWLRVQGDEPIVKVLDIDNRNRVKLTIKEITPEEKAAFEAEAAAEPQL